MMTVHTATERTIAIPTTILITLLTLFSILNLTSSMLLRQTASRYRQLSTINVVPKSMTAMNLFLPLLRHSRSRRCILPLFESSFSLSSSLCATTNDNNDNNKNTPTFTTLNKNTDGNYYSSEQIIKKSRFIGIASHCETWDDARDFIDRVRQDHPKSRHACFGFVAGSNPVQERSSDDGEPSGTAGQPILGGIKGEGLSDTICVVVRYSGGVKLGAGGLIRAYGGTARLVLREADRSVMIMKSSIHVKVSSSFTGKIYSTVTKFGGIISAGDETYDEFGDVNITIVCETERVDAMLKDISNVTRGNAVFSS